MINNIFKKFWIFQKNLYSTLLILSEVIGYDIDDDDFNAIDYGLQGTSDEKNIWWYYQLIGDHTIYLQLAKDEENTDIVFIQLTFEEQLSKQVNLVIFVVQEFDLKYRHSKNIGS